MAIKAGSRKGSEIRCHFGTCKCDILLLFTILQQGRAFQKTITFGTLFGVLFGPQVSNKWSSNGRIQIGKQLVLGSILGSFLDALGLSQEPGPAQPASPARLGIQPAHQPSPAKLTGQPSPSQTSPAQRKPDKASQPNSQVQSWQLKLNQ